MAINNSDTDTIDEDLEAIDIEYAEPGDEDDDVSDEATISPYIHYGELEGGDVSAYVDPDTSVDYAAPIDYKDSDDPYANLLDEGDEHFPEE